jgi:RNA polymerase sigma-70 factor (family 1)
MIAAMPIAKKNEETALLELLSQDSEYAFQLLFDRYRDKVYKVALLYLKSPALAEEVVQDIFLKLWFQRKHLKEIRSIESWLFILTKNLTINYLKKIAYEWTARKKWITQNSLTENTTDHKVRNAEFQQILSTAIQQLPAQQQKVYKLVKEEGLSYQDCAQQLSMSSLTVKTHMSRALASIRSYLQENGKDFLLLFLLMFLLHY